MRLFHSVPNLFIFFPHSDVKHCIILNINLKHGIWTPMCVHKKCSNMRKSSYLLKKKSYKKCSGFLNHLPEKVHNEESSEKPHLALLALDVKHMWFVCSLSVYTVHIHTDLKNKSSLQNSSMTCLLQYMLNLASVVSISCSWRKGEK